MANFENLGIPKFGQANLQSSGLFSLRKVCLKKTWFSRTRLANFEHLELYGLVMANFEKLGFPRRGRTNLEKVGFGLWNLTDLKFLTFPGRNWAKIENSEVCGLGMVLITLTFFCFGISFQIFSLLWQVNLVFL